LDLIYEISNVIPPTQATLVSFDVEGLFPNVPIPTLLELTLSSLTGSVSNGAVGEYMELLALCLIPNFNGDFYTIPDGVPMDSPLAPTIAEVSMKYFEELIFKSNNPSLPII